MAGLGAKGAHSASRKENIALNRLQIQHATFLSQHTIFFLQCCWEILLPESQAGRLASRAGRSACLVSTLCSKKTSSNTLRQAPAFDVLPHSSERLSRFLAVSWVQPGLPEPGVYLNRNRAILLSCRCPSTDAISFPQPTPGAESRNLRVFSLQNEERNQPQALEKKHKPKMKLCWRRKLNTMSWPLIPGTWKRMMILHTEQECRRFSTLSLDHSVRRDRGEPRWAIRSQRGEFLLQWPQWMCLLNQI